MSTIQPQNFIPDYGKKHLLSTASVSLVAFLKVFDDNKLRRDCRGAWRLHFDVPAGKDQSIARSTGNSSARPHGHWTVDRLAVILAASVPLPKLRLTGSIAIVGRYGT